MNKIYKVIWNSQLSCWQVVSEIAKSHTTSSQKNSKTNHSNVVNTLATLLLFSIAILPLSVHAAISNTALPTGAQITSGSGSFSQTNDTLTITQNSQNLSSNWNSFNIGQDATVTFNQPNQSSVAINQVLDSNASQIMGRLNANGQVFLLNPNGVVFSKSAQVNVGGIVASTLGLDNKNDNNSDSQNGSYTLTGDANSNATITNHGKINTLAGGTVALIAPNVINTGTIDTPNGITHLTSASQVTLALQDGSLTQYQVDRGVLKGLVDNKGAIIADNGAIYLTAKAKDTLSQSVVNHSGIIKANRLTQNAKGEIILLGDMQVGETNVSGTLEATGKAQDGGFIETSAATVKIADTAKVTTVSDTGKTGTWLIDPTDFTISAGNGTQTASGIGADALQTNLSTTSVAIQTLAAGPEKGDINVDAAVSWNANTELTLNAHNNININADITASGANGKLNLIYGQDAANTNATYSLNNGAKVNLKAGQNFSTKKGNSDQINYQVITALGSANSVTRTDLQGINGNLSGNYVLGEDIDAGATSSWSGGFNPIGDGSNAFRGTLDGLGHTVNGLTIDRPSLFSTGLISTNEGNIRNIGMVGGSVVGNYFAGGLVGSNTGSITNAYATGDVTSTSFFDFVDDFYIVGGLVGYNQGNITNAYATGAVTANSSNSYAGGLAGENYGSISNSYATGAVTANGSNSYAGGLAGENYYGSISNAYAAGAVTANGSNSYAGGLVGDNYYGNISNAYATGTVTANDPNSRAGGLVGDNSSGSSIDNAYAAGTVTASNDNSNVGGLVGENLGSISNAYAIGAVKSNGSNSNVGGLVGDNYRSISNVYATGSVTATGSNSRAGGLVGYNYLGGIITNAYATGAVKATSSSSKTGGLVGFNELEDISSAYWNIETSGQTNAVGSGSGNANATGLTSEQMKQADYFNGFDIDDAGGTGKVWRIYEGQTNPLLRSFLTQVDLSAVNETTTYNGQNQTLAQVAGLDPTKLLTDNSASSINAGTYNADYYSNQQGYDLINNKLVTLTIDRKALTITNLSADDKTYDGTTDATLSGGILNGLIDNETLSLDSLRGNFVDKNAGNNKKVTVSGDLSNGDNGGLASNYSVAHPTGLSADIDKARATVIANSANTTYNGQSQSVTGFMANGLVNGESESVLTNVIATGASRTDAGSYANTVSGTDNNYELTLIDGSLDIAKAQATVTANSANTTYTGVEQNVDGFSASGLVNGETIAELDNVTATGATGTNAGSYANTVSGKDNNYDLTFVDGALTIDKAKAIITANSKNTTYNGKSQSVTGFTASGLVNNETIDVLDNVSASATGKNAGSYTNTATGTDNNYDLTFKNGALNIAKAQATVTANSKNTTYNGKSQSVTGFTASGLVNNETIGVLDNVNASGATGKNAGSYENVVSGDDNNYDLTFKNGALNIAKAQATVTANSANTTYNGLEQSVNGFTASGLVNNETIAELDNVIASSASGTNAGSYANTVSGQDNNYDLILVDGSLVIGKASATVTANSANTTYNGKSQSVTGFTASGLVNNETIDVLDNVNASGATGKNAGSYENIVNGTDNNYDLTFYDGALTIDKAQATVTANSKNTTYNGVEQSVDGFMASGLVNGEDISVLDNVTASGATGTNAGNYANTVSGTDNNYDLTFNDGVLTINKAQATVTANSKNTTYNGKSQSVTGFTASGLVNNETIDVLDNVNASGATGKNAGSYKNIATGSNNNYNLTFVDGALTIDKAKIAKVTGIRAEDRLFNNTTGATLNTDSAQFDGIFGDDQLTVNNAIGAFEDAQAGLDKTVNITDIRLGGVDIGNYELIDTTATARADIYPLTPPQPPTPTEPITPMLPLNYLQALPVRHNLMLPTANNIAIAQVDVINGGVNTAGLSTLSGVR